MWLFGCLGLNCDGVSVELRVHAEMNKRLQSDAQPESKPGLLHSGGRSVEDLPMLPNKSWTGHSPAGVNRRFKW